MSEYGMSKMENNEIMNTNMEDIKMRTIKELLDSNVSREEMTVEEERAFVNYWFDLHDHLQQMYPSQHSVLKCLLRPNLSLLV